MKLRVKIQWLFFSILVLCIQKLYSQDSPVLFYIDDTPVELDEFNYIYKKNNGEKADYSRESIEEYLDLYIKFKLKVQKARQLKMDTISALNEELAGYRRQLAKSYLVDKELVSSLVDNAYERKQKDLRISHLLLKLNKNASAEEEKIVFDRIIKIRDKIRQGADFKLITQTLSEDAASSPSGGNLGWMTAMLPNGFYEFENAIYDLEIGEVSQPVRSMLGYHLIKLTDTRQAKGEMEVSHILVRSKRKGQYIEGAKTKIDSIHQLLDEGASFEDIAKQLSEDKNTAAKGGYLGYFSIGQYDLVFEDAAFRLKENGAFTRPVQTAIGWHIIKRNNKKDYSDDATMKKSLKTQISKSDRFEIARKAMIERIKKESGFNANEELISSFVNNLDSRFFSYKWEVPAIENAELFNFGNENKYSLKDFASYCKKNTRKRMQYNKNESLENVVNDFFREFVDEKAIEFEETVLEKKYPDFKALMREYAEGILLFEVTKIHVWDKAPKDTVGLQSFYEKNMNRYSWKERGVITTYIISSINGDLLNDIKKKIQFLPAEDVLALYNIEKELISYNTQSFERNSKEFMNMKWEEGFTSTPRIFPASKNAEIKKLTNILEPRNKTMDEARGYIIADYQDQLESEWVNDLKKEFKVRVNNDVLQRMIKA